MITSTDGENWVTGPKPPEFTKESNGYGTPQIQAMVYGGGQFVAVGMLGMIWTSRGVLDPGRTTNVKVYFKPKAKGPQTATLIMSGNAPAVKVTLSGKGV